MLRFVRYKICPCVDDGEDTEAFPTLFMAESEAKNTQGEVFWSLYGSGTDGPSICIGDYETEEDALKVYAMITGRNVPQSTGNMHLLLGPEWRHWR